MNLKRRSFILFISILVFFSCGGKKHGAEEEDPREVKGVPVSVRELADETGGFGSLSFLTKIDIAAPQDGVIRKLYVREGDTVEQGEAALRLENPQLDLAVERAENTHAQAGAACELARSRLLEGEFQAEVQLLGIEKAEAELEQTRKIWEENRRKHLNQEALFEAGGIQEETIRSGRFSLESGLEQIRIMEKDLEMQRVGCREKDLEAAGIPIPRDEGELRRALIALMTGSLRAELDAARAQLDAAEKELRSMRIAQAELSVRSPGSGVVGARYFEEGERVKAEDKIFTLMDTASLYAIFPVREKEALRIEKGMAAKVEIDGTGEIREGRVDLVYPQADSQSLSFLVRVLLDRSPHGENAGGGNAGGSGKSRDPKPGMFTRVTVLLGPPRRAFMVPETAVINKRDGAGTVFVINSGTLSERKVTLGTTLGDEREISSGLNAGELVVLRPDRDMREGTHVSALY
jgi:multidrug efflux pump subunit AcrA (membrane-fusion protein)